MHEFDCTQLEYLSFQSYFVIENKNGLDLFIDWLWAVPLKINTFKVDFILALSTVNLNIFNFVSSPVFSE